MGLAAEKIEFRKAVKPEPYRKILFRGYIKPEKLDIELTNFDKQALKRLQEFAMARTGFELHELLRELKAYEMHTGLDKTNPKFAYMSVDEFELWLSSVGIERRVFYWLDQLRNITDTKLNETK